METGEQPCDDFDPGGTGSEYNYHECPGCCGTRRFCNNCNRDHHSMGWERCARRAAAKERQRIVAYLRGVADAAPWSEATPHAALDTAADDIEREQHHKSAEFAGQGVRRGE